MKSFSAIFPDVSQAARLACAFFLALSAACLTRPAPALAALVAGIVLCAALRPPLAKTVKRLAVANFFLLFIWLTALWTTPGDPVWTAGPVTVTVQGLNLCLLTTVKANAVLLLFMALTSGIGMTGLGDALLRLHFPNSLALMIVLMGRNTMLLKHQWRKLREAASVRGFKSGASIKSYRVLAALLALLVIRASDRASSCHEAMLLRGFDGTLRSGNTQAWPWPSLICLFLGAGAAFSLSFWDIFL